MPARVHGGDMVLVPAGDFWMGSDSPRPEEAPRHSVNLDAFEIDRYEVTNARYRSFIDAGGYTNPAFWSADGWNWVQRWGIGSPEQWGKPGWSDPAQPVVGVAWYEADAFCRFEGLRLPTEAEWEKAARGTDEREFPWGGQWQAAHAQGPLAGGTAIVGTHAGGASPYGVEDMAGNAAEWVADWYQPGYSGAGATNPTGPATGRTKVLRGGSWASLDTGRLRTTARDMLNVQVGFKPRFNAFGFRCARSVA